MQTSLFNENTSQKTYIQQVREKINFYGAEEASLQDLLALLIGKNNPEICSKLASLDVRELMGMSIEDFMQIKGIGKRLAEQLYATISLSKKLYKLNIKADQKISSPHDVYAVFSYLQHEMQEHLVVAYLNTKNMIIGRKTVFIGSLNSSEVHPREVFNDAVKRSACSIIVAHNHPSGDPTPSNEDIQVTKRLVEAGKILGIELLDHCIIGNGKYISLKEKGYV